MHTGRYSSKTVVQYKLSIFFFSFYSGDEAAAKRIVLPCYKALYRMFLVVYIILLFALTLIVSPIADWNSEAYFRTVQYISFSILSIYSVVPVLLVQSSISITAFRTALLVSLPWWITGTVLWITGTLAVESSSSSSSSYVAVEVSFALIASLCPSSLCVCILFKVIPSRVQLGSTSNRNAVELLLAYSLVFGIVYVCGGSGGGGVDYVWGRDVALIMTSVSCLGNVVFPWALYRYIHTCNTRTNILAR